MQTQKQKQHRNQQTKQPQIKEQAAPIYTYTSKCCEAPATKPPCERSREDRRENKFSRAGLGHWRCTKCAAGCKVKRSKATPKEDEV